jgi:hypothetical protein
MHLNQKTIKLFILGFVITLLTSCEKKVEEKYIVKVGDSYLSEEELNALVSYGSDSSKFKEEFIRQWIEDELLFMAAKEKGIVQTKEFKSLAERSERKTANTLLIKQILSDTKIYEDSASVKKYFKVNASEFKLTQPAIIYNYASFNKLETAEGFRISLYQNNWDDAINVVNQNNELIDSGKELFFYVVKESQDIYRDIYKSLIRNQVSEVKRTFNGLYLVFILLEKYDKNEIPSLDVTYDLVKDRFIAKQRELAYKNYVKQLYANYSSRIER